MKQMIKKMAVVLSLALVCAPMGAMGATNKLIVTRGATTTPAMVVDDRGFVGIGTDTPSSGLNIVGPSASASQIRSIFTGTTAGGGGGFYGLHMNDSTTNGGLPRQGDRIGYLQFGSLTGAVGAPTTIPLGAGFEAKAEGNWSASSFPTYYVFQTAATGQNFLNERMRITSLGRVGINTSSPTALLEVNGGIRILPVTQDVNKETTPTATAKPTCAASRRGTLWFVPQAVGADTLEICMATSNGGSFAWKVITIAP